MLRSDRRNSSKMACWSAGGMPSPVSRTRTITPAALVSSWRVTSPRAVNLTALLTRFSATWRRRVRSPHTHGPDAGRSACQDSPLACANWRPISATTLSAWPRSTNSLVRRSCPASLLARSSTSPMSPPRCWALALMRSTSLSCNRIPLNPTMRFSGVRSSWLTVDRKRLFIRFASSARRRPSVASRYNCAVLSAAANCCTIAP